MALKQMERGGTGMRTPLQERFQGSLGAEVSRDSLRAEVLVIGGEAQSGQEKHGRQRE